MYAWQSKEKKHVSCQIYVAFFPLKKQDFVCEMLENEQQLVLVTRLQNVVVGVFVLCTLPNERICWKRVQKLKLNIV